MHTLTSVFVAILAKISDDEVTKTMRCIQEKIRIFSAPIRTTRLELFVGSLLMICYLTAKFCPNQSSFRRDIIMQKCLPKPLQ